MIRSFFHAWERRLAYSDDFERRVLPFDWGPEFLPSFGDSDSGGPRELVDPRKTLHAHVRRALADSDAYFDLPPVDDFRLEDGQLTFTSPAPTGVLMSSFTARPPASKMWPIKPNLM